MVEVVMMLVIIIAICWVMFWSMLQEKLKRGEPAKGFFATKYDDELRKRNEEKKISNKTNTHNFLADRRSGQSQR